MEGDSPGRRPPVPTDESVERGKPSKREKSPPAKSRYFREVSKKPRYVEMCGKRTVALLNYETGEHGLTPYLCKSWRCPDCASWVNRQDAERIALAVARHGGTESFVLMIPTFARQGRAGVKGWTSAEDAYKGAYQCFGKLSKRLGRRYPTIGPDSPKPKFIYVCTVEAHKDGFPHLNVLWYQPELAERMRQETFRPVWDELIHAVKDCGFGSRFYVASVEAEDEQMANYMVKQADLGTRVSREVAKDRQVPVNAPRGFCRLRGSRGFLPPKQKGPYVGEFIRAEPEIVARQFAANGGMWEFSAETLERARLLAETVLLRDSCPHESEG